LGSLAAGEIRIDLAALFRRERPFAGHKSEVQPIRV
jgi:hypothetical protein